MTEISITPQINSARRLSHILLNAPARLNSLSVPMCNAIGAELDSQRGTESPAHAVVINGAGERAFCSGGDIRQIYSLIDQGESEQAANFFASEYINNWRIHHFAKPFIALMDGITMGGGAGVSVVGNTPVATDRTIFAMPETAIGFVPDCGVAWYLARLGAVGMYLALSGARVDGADLLRLALAKHYVLSSRIPELLEDFAQAIGSLPQGCLPEEVHAAVSTVFNDFKCVLPTEGTLTATLPEIERCYGARGGIQEIINLLRATNSPWSRNQLDILHSHCPETLAVTYHHISTANRLSFAQVLQRDYVFAIQATQGTDLKEGIRAMVIDKDRHPTWSTSAIAPLSPQQISHWFAELPEDKKLRLTWG